MLLDSIKAPCVADLVRRLEERLPPLEPKGAADTEIQQALDSTPLERLFEGESIVSEDFARAVQSGLYLWNDCLDASHKLSQKIETETGSYWHAVMHRREPDYSNSKHWWRRVGEHPLFPEVRASALRVLSNAESGWGLETRKRLEASDGWLPFDFVDWCEACATGRLAEARPILEQIQLEEIKRLMAYSYRRAVR
ncbi:MAG: hypothetical protein EXS64_06320 [Candidatus Latescibacteria bacterium]|nr:hypothetical protein [Candidatus Latescibacterota bacterium]